MEATEPEAAPPPKAAALTYVNGGDITAKPGAQIKGGSVLSQIAAEGEVKWVEASARCYCLAALSCC